MAATPRDGPIDSDVVGSRSIVRGADGWMDGWLCHARKILLEKAGELYGGREWSSSFFNRGYLGARKKSENMIEWE